MLQRSIFVFSLALLIAACNVGQSQTGVKPVLDVVEFEQTIRNAPAALIVDVRTPAEFAKGHLENAVNIDINSPDFENRLAQLDKNQPILVYCLSGGRSAAAGAKMRQSGFSHVQELQGGTLAWRQAGLPLVTTSVPEQKETTYSPPASASKPAKLVSLTESDFQNLLKNDKLVLIDYYAEWCGPCKMMKPFLDDLSKEMHDKLVIYRIDVDKNESLATSKGITGLPTLVLYKGGKSVWSHLGYIDKAGLKRAVQSNF